MAKPEGHDHAIEIIKEYYREYGELQASDIMGIPPYIVRGVANDHVKEIGTTIVRRALTTYILWGSKQGLDAQYKGTRKVQSNRHDTHRETVPWKEFH